MVLTFYLAYMPSWWVTNLEMVRLLVTLEMVKVFASQLLSAIRRVLSSQRYILEIDPVVDFSAMLLID
jgi:hypothetical protein